MGTAAVKTSGAHIVLTPGTCGGRPRIAGHRITVQDVAIWHERMAMSVDEIAHEYSLSLADVYAALTYYCDHREEVDQRIKEDDEFVEEMRRKTPSLLKQKLRRLHGQ